MENQNKIVYKRNEDKENKNEEMNIDTSNGSNKKDGNQFTYFLVAIVLSIILIAGTAIYTTNIINDKLNEINSNINIIRASLTSAPAINNNIAQPSDLPSSNNSFKANLSGITPLGDPNAPITIIEYSDFQCPFCLRVQPTIKQILNDYKGKVKLYYKQFPLIQIHPNARKAAEAALLAGDQGKFWEYHNKLFENQNNLDVESLKRYAAELGLDTVKFNAGLDNGEKATQVNSELQEGLANGVQGTPTFFINGQMISGAQPYSVFKQVIDAQLAQLNQ
ncbi:MAG: DsbA family protein [Candidatus Micrarchaeia archaeon]